MKDLIKYTNINFDLGILFDLFVEQKLDKPYWIQQNLGPTW